MSSMQGCLDFLFLSASRGQPINRTGFIHSFFLKDIFDNMKDRLFFSLFFFSQIKQLVQVDTSITRSLNTIELGYFFSNE